MVIVDNSIIASRDYGIVSIEILPHNICRVTALSNIFFNQKRELIRENIINNIVKTHFIKLLTLIYLERILKRLEAFYVYSYTIPYRN